MKDAVVKKSMKNQEIPGENHGIHAGRSAGCDLMIDWGQSFLKKRPAPYFYPDRVAKPKGLH